MMEGAWNWPMHIYSMICTFMLRVEVLSISNSPPQLLGPHNVKIILCNHAPYLLQVNTKCSITQSDLYFNIVQHTFAATGLASRSGLRTATVNCNLPATAI